MNCFKSLQQAQIGLGSQLPLSNLLSLTDIGDAMRTGDWRARMYLCRRASCCPDWHSFIKRHSLRLLDL